MHFFAVCVWNHALQSILHETKEITRPTYDDHKGTRQNSMLDEIVYRLTLDPQPS